MDLFDYMREQNMEKESPLAARLRPTTLDEVVGQEHIIGKDKLLYRAIKADKLSSILFYGPPGTGKTTLAKVIANTTSAEFLQMNATSAGKKDMEEVVQQAKNNQGMYGKKTILFIDEIHRFNKGQQDYLLPFVEDGTIILIGATTENPYFEVNGALLSRSIIFELHALEKEDMKILMHFFKCVMSGVVLNWMDHRMSYDLIEYAGRLQSLYGDTFEKTLEKAAGVKTGKC